MTNTFRIALLQMTSHQNWRVNLDLVEKLIKTAAIDNPELIVLPEFFIQITDAEDNSRFDIAIEDNQAQIINVLKALALQYNVAINAGSILTRDVINNKYYNTSLVIDSCGNIVARYNKIHLFKYSNGSESYDESSYFSAGDKLTTFNLNGWSFGLAICYDLRFPELFRALNPVDVILLPSAFTYSTGVAHWEVLSRARAIENQCYFIAVNQGGLHETGRKTYGNSMAIDPWGNIMVRCDEGNHVLIVDLDKNMINQIRNKIPALQHKRIDLF